MRRGRPTKLFELIVILAVVFGIRAASRADALASLQGTVRSAAGIAIAGASVSVSCGSTTRSTTADSSGAFTITGLPEGSCTVTVTAAGFANAASKVAVSAKAVATVRLALAPRVPVVTKTDPRVVNKPEPARDMPRPMPREESKPMLRKRSPMTVSPSPMAPPPVAQIAGARQQPMVLDTPSNTEAYARIDDNPFFRTATAPLSTFSSDVDTASYSNLRRFLRDGKRPPKDAVRIEEMVNYFKYEYPQPAKGEPFSISTDIGPAPWNAKHQLVRIGLKAPSIDDAQVPARNLVFLLDVSGSMNAPNKLPLLKQAMGLLVETLRPQDTVSITVYAGASGIALPPTSGRDKDKIRQAIFALEAGGSTNGAAGIQLAYEVAERSLVKNGINRVILCTDGDFNVGPTSEGELTRLIEKERERGIFLTVLGFGMGNLKDSTMEKLANRGNGNYGYIDSIFEARKILVKEAGATLVTVAKDVKLQIEFNPAMVAGYRLIGYENRIMRHEDFNDDKKDAGDIGAGHAVTALYEIVPAGIDVPSAKVDDLKYGAKPASAAAASSGELMTVKVRYKAPTQAGATSKLLSRIVKGAPGELAKMSADFRWTAAIAGFGMMLRDSPHRSNLTWKQVENLAEGALGSDAEGYRKQALEMIRAAAKTPSTP
ncbi:MAG: von Willebrand factor type A domain-containing protein [Deltaproteobacteria bacterium]|nr:von Willebrand factor type A domain-containing protein [Deltaproteobacteria bacterium]MDQ3300513.1 von Willebrand factor type A domain-containing protein [Myxococcota bacterium]